MKPPRTKPQNTPSSRFDALFTVFSGRSRAVLLPGLVLLLAACTGETDAADPVPLVVSTTTPTELALDPDLATTQPVQNTIDSPVESTIEGPVEDTQSTNVATPAPDWLGSRVLPTLPDGSVTPQTTPDELIDRQLVTTDTLPPPPTNSFVGTVEPVSEAVAQRSTWNAGCPVQLDELRYLQLSFWGFDGLHHQGEMIVHADVADSIVSVFEKMHEARFPIEEMRIVTNADVAAKPTGDGNNTSSFVCRNVTNGSSFSQHAYGLAIDINPFHNPYRRGDLVLPELSTAYLDRDRVVKGMVVQGDVVQTAFEEIGWSWGGNWNSLKDYQHFSANGK